MYRQLLCSNWRMRRCGDAGYDKAVVPGSVYADLLRNGRMEDPFYRDNEDEALKRMDADYEYVTEFACDEELFACDEVVLRFEGVDTIADIWLNGILIGSTDNMHRIWEFPVRDLLRRNGDIQMLQVIFHSPTRYIAEAFAQAPTRGTEDAMDGFVHIRKAHYMFGWDWGAHLPDAGLFRPVMLLGIEKARLDSVYITQHHTEGSVDLTFDIQIYETQNELFASDSVPFLCEIIITDPDGKIIIEKCIDRKIINQKTTGHIITPQGTWKTTVSVAVTIPAPRLWWPNGYGDQPLYTAEVRLLSADSDGRVPGTSGVPGTSRVPGTSCVPGIIRVPETSCVSGTSRVPGTSSVPETSRFPGTSGAPDTSRVPGTSLLLDTWKKKIGLRTLTMNTEKDEWGSKFACRVNGIDIFSMGADYIPEDHLVSRVTPETTRALLEKAKWANFNTIRVWGGGYYPDDWFYDICDELGLIVWQDFMFACAVYDLTPAFEENIRAEITDNVRRLRHHASLGLWCGNNEMESFVSEGVWVTKPEEVRDYLFMYERIIPEILRREDPARFYWPSSPSSGGSFDKPQDPDRGDVHYWDVWHRNKPFTEYRIFHFRYLSEFGFQSFPAMKTIASISDDPEDYNIFSYIMERHQRNGSANGKIMNYMQQMFRYPSDFETVLYASQLLQAEAIRYGVEHFRRNRGRCMGTVYWQLNDCWPAASWSSVDYFGRQKALHYYAKRFYEPLMISCEENGLINSGRELNRQHFKDFEKSIRLHVANETMQEARATVRWALRNAKAQILREEVQEVNVPPLSGVWLEKTELPDIDLYGMYISYELEKDGEIISAGTVILSCPKYFRYEDPHLTYSIEGDRITVFADAYAKSVEIRNENEDLILTDNYFDMNAGSRTVRIESGSAGKLRLRSVYDIK